MGKKEIICGIYKITSPSGRVYIGESGDVKERWRSYRKPSFKGQRRLNNSFKSYGVKNHTFEVIEECEFDYLLCRERYWQDFYDVLGKKGMNCKLTECGDKKQVTSQETIEKIRLARLGSTHTDEVRNRMSVDRMGEGNNFFGKTHTDETKDIIREARTGSVKSEESKRKQGESIKGDKNHFFGKTHTDETKDILRQLRQKILLNVETGIYYFGCKAAAESINMSYYCFLDRMKGKTKNNTPFIYV